LSDQSPAESSALSPAPPKRPYPRKFVEIYRQSNKC
jgi:hypothetical protein